MKRGLILEKIEENTEPEQSKSSLAKIRLKKALAKRPELCEIVRNQTAHAAFEEEILELVEVIKEDPFVVEHLQDENGSWLISYLEDL